jgi:hypothetical protein
MRWEGLGAFVPACLEPSMHPPPARPRLSARAAPPCPAPPAPAPCRARPRPRPAPCAPARLVLAALVVGLAARQALVQRRLALQRRRALGQPAGALARRLERELVGGGALGDAGVAAAHDLADVDAWRRRRGKGGSVG